MSSHLVNDDGVLLCVSVPPKAGLIVLLFGRCVECPIVVFADLAGVI